MARKLENRSIGNIIRFAGIFTIHDVELLCRLADCEVGEFLDTVEYMSGVGEIKTDLVNNTKVWTHYGSNSALPTLEEFYLELIKMCTVAPISLTVMSNTTVGKKLGLGLVREYMADLLADNKIRKAKRVRGTPTYVVVVDPKELINTYQKY